MTSRFLPSPYLETDMPFDVILAYLVCDTLRKTYTKDELKELANTISVDSLRSAFQMQFRLKDYDPLLFYRLWTERDPQIQANYRSTIEDVFVAIASAYYKRIEPVNDWIALLLRRDAIYHVRAVNQAKRIDSVWLGYYRFQDRTTETYCADLHIIDKIMGEKTRNLCRSSTSEDEPNSCTSISWTRWGFKDHPREADSLWIEKQGPLFIVPGKEYIVFLEYSRLPVVDEVNTYWAITSAGPRVYPIEDGFVIDMHNHFKLGVQIPLDDFKAYLRSKIQETFYQ